MSMGKGDKKKPLPKLAAIPKRQPNGQHRARVEQATDPRKTVLNTRCRLAGVDQVRANRLAMTGPESGSGAGMCIAWGRKKGEAAQHWAVWQGYCGAVATYRTRIIGVSGNPQGSNIAMEPDITETDQSHSVDTREPDQKDRDAVTNWMRWQGHLGCLPSGMASTIARANGAEDEAYWADHEPTAEGLLFRAAIERLSKAVGG